jgi:hypothetical protein
VPDAAVTAICECYRIVAAEFGIRARGPRSAVQRRQAARYLAWCRKQDVDPALYLDDRAAQAKRQKAPLPPIGRLPSQAALASHREFGAGRVLAARADAEVELIDCTGAAPRKLRPHQEKFKADHVGCAELCARYPEHSGGYSKQSEWCGRCPATVSCIRPVR